jgi:N-methylhydantoinase A/oxoprolinase/acetone carboxylase beta subunit
MVRAIELNSVRKGYDPREFALVAFGGAGPLSACDIALELSIPRVVVPRHPGIASALGLLATDLKLEVARTVMVEAGSVDPAFLDEAYRELESEARARLHADGVPEESIVVERWADCRYTGQAYELLIQAPGGALDEAALRALEDAFHERHEREYFWRFTDKPVQVVHLRVYAIGVMPALAAEEVEPGSTEPPEHALVATLPVVFHVDGSVERLDTAFWDVGALRAGNVLAGPAVVEHQDSTTVVNPGLVAEVDRHGSLLIDCEGEA